MDGTHFLKMCLSMGKRNRNKRWKWGYHFRIPSLIWYDIYKTSSFLAEPDDTAILAHAHAAQSQRSVKRLWDATYELWNFTWCFCTSDPPNRPSRNSLSKFDIKSTGYFIQRSIWSRSVDNSPCWAKRQSVLWEGKSSKNAVGLYYSSPFFPPLKAPVSRVAHRNVKSIHGDRTPRREEIPQNASLSAVRKSTGNYLAVQIGFRRRFSFPCCN